MSIPISKRAYLFGQAMHTSHTRTITDQRKIAHLLYSIGFACNVWRQVVAVFLLKDMVNWLDRK